MSLRGAPGLVFLIFVAGCATDSSRPVVAPPPSTAQRTFDQLWDRARIDSSGQQGKDWESANNDALEEILNESDRVCRPAASLAASDELDTSFVLEIERGGRVRRIHASRIADDSECRRKVLMRAVFSPPPWDGYHFGVLLSGRTYEYVHVSPRTRLPETATLEDASRRALTDMNTTEGIEWLMSREEGLTTAIRSLVTQCPMLLESTDSNVLVTFEIASDGAVRRVLTADAAQLDCARSELRRQRLKPPPWDGFWFTIENLKK